MEIGLASSSSLDKLTVEKLLSNISSGIAIDASKNHTGVIIWNGSTIEDYGFKLDSYSKDDNFAEYRMRRQFKSELEKIVNGRFFEVCIIEDVYGGENFDTVRKLLAINTVIDELIFENKLVVDNFYRWNEPVWTSLLRHIYKQRGKLKSKIETQGVLEHLEFDFYLKNKDLSESRKKEIFFEDKCDVCGMLLAVVAMKILDINMTKSRVLKMSDIKMTYVEYLEDTYSCRDKRVAEEGFIGVELDFRNLEKSILKEASMHPNDVLCAFLPSSKLGVFGTKHGFRFYDNDESYLLFYNKTKQ